MEIDDVQYSVNTVKTGGYATYEIKTVSVGTEVSSGFVGEISNIGLTFTGSDALEFQINVLSNDALMGSPDANISIYNKEIKINSGSNNIFSVDNLNNQILIKDCDLNI